MCNYCTFYNNTVSSYICIYLWGNSGNISKSYIIINNSPTNYGVVTLWEGNYKAEISITSWFRKKYSLFKKRPFEWV